MLKVGIAGAGVVGKRRRASINRHPGLRVVAMCDRNFPGNSVEEDGVKIFSNYHELLDEPLDVMVVCMTNDIAAEVTVAGLERGLHVFCEKPPGREVADIRRVRAVERTRPGQKLMYGFNHRYHESILDAQRIIRSGELGSIINLRGVYGKSKIVTFDQSDWRTKRAIAGGGVLLDQGIHMVDLMRFFAGDFVEVKSFVSNRHWRFDVEDNAYALMRTADGTIAMLNSSATQWRHRFNLEITLERGSLILGGILTGSKSYGAETLTVVTADPQSDSGDPREQLTRYNHDPSWDAEITVFADCILEDRPIVNGSSSEALKTMKLVYKIYYADAEWRTQFGIADPDLSTND